jgi:hypothetical protein
VIERYKTGKGHESRTPAVRRQQYVIQPRRS